MKFVQFTPDGGPAEAGLLTDRGVLPLQALSPSLPSTVLELCRGGAAVLDEIRRLVRQAPEEAYLSPAALRWAPPVTGMEKTLCIGLNYRKHAEELGISPAQYPTVFCKLPNALAAHDQRITIPRGAVCVDYEAELVIIMGGNREIWGYTCGNDLSIREWQRETQQWLVGKSADGFGPIGPCAVTADALDGDRLSIESRVNGQVRQHSNTDDMIFNCRAIVDYIDQRIPLKPGDLIFTGTPSGVMQGYPREQQHWLRPGDVVEVELEGIGVLRNTLS